MPALPLRYVGLFSGIGGFEEAFRRAGAHLIGLCEIEMQARSVLRRHFPGVEIVNDVRSITAKTFGRRPIDLLTGGFPCQDLSMAGRRAGLAGERSGLWFEFVRTVGLYHPRWVVIENVPGLLSSAGGRDFATILRGLVELGYCVAWRVLDAQFDGVPQRRQRVFLVASLGNGGAVEILFERDGSAWNPPPRREEGASVAALTANGVGTCGADDNQAQAGHLVVTTWDERNVINLAKAGGGLGTDFDCGGGLITFGGNNTNGPLDVSTACNAHHGRLDFESETFVVHPHIAHALTAEGADASEDGTGRGTPIVAFSSKDAGQDSQENIAPTLRAMNFDTSHINRGGQVAVVCPIGRTFGIRRLTPGECERLQGYPKNWTAYGDDGRAISDSARYRLLGNSVCLPVVEWIAQRIVAYS